MGFKVYDLEDTGGQLYNPIRGRIGGGLFDVVSFLKRFLSELSSKLGQHWHYRAMDGTAYGMET